jgi:replicative DNA helicase
VSYLAEQSAIGAMLIDAACVPSAIKALRVDDFESRPCRELFVAGRGGDDDAKRQPA